MNIKSRRSTLLLIAAICLMLLAACGDAGRADASSGRVLLWHAWGGPEAAALESILTRFRDLNPDVQVQVRSFGDENAMLEEFRIAAASGLGPDLLLSSSPHLRDLAEDGLIDDIGLALSEEELARYVPPALATLTFDDGIYGIPESQYTMVLYYNRNLVDVPPATLKELLEDVEAGAIVLIGTQFVDAFWGVQAFGGRLFDDDGRVILDQGGFANWLAWLTDARDLPGVVLDSNRQALQQRFIEGEVDYYVGSSRELVDLQEAMGEDVVGVAALPAGPLGPAGPFVNTRALFFSAVSSANQRRLALDLAKFITNSEQSSTLLREANHVPANQGVRINPRLNPLVNEVAKQTRTGVPMLSTDRMQTVLDMAEDIYTRVVEGVSGPAEAAAALTQSINDANDIPASQQPISVCRDVGSLQILNAWEAPRQAWLTELARQYRRICPAIILDVIEVTAEEVLAMAEDDPAALDGYQMIAGSQLLLARLADTEHLLRLDNIISAEDLQRFRPVSLQAMAVDEGLYGIPALVDVSALYHNIELASDPARTLSELRAEAETGVPVILETGFVPAFWGIGAMGGALVGDEAYTPAQFVDSFAAWLEWLRETRDQTPAALTDNQAALVDAFISGESAYLISDLRPLAILQAALGDSFSATILPAGPGGQARPLVAVDGFMFGRDMNREDVPLALNFINYLTSELGQTYLTEPGAGLPAAITDDNALAEDPIYQAFIEEARAAAHLPTVPELPALIAAGDAAYRAVLEEDVDPQEAALVAAMEMQRIVDPETEFILPTDTPTVPVTVVPPAISPEVSPPITATLTPTDPLGAPIMPSVVSNDPPAVVPAVAPTATLSATHSVNGESRPDATDADAVDAADGGNQSD